MKTYIVALLAILLSIPAMSQTQRALIIGIDAYDPPEGVVVSTEAHSIFPSLDGCKNDAIAMRDAVVARYGFKKEKGYMRELYDSMATRKNILDGMNELLMQSKSGDIAFIFYAGHGSQVKNSLSHEPGQQDESMVPSDTWKEGVYDIRDKELGKILNAFVDKGVILTLIYDCCHSSNMSRGISEQPKSRFIPTSTYDAKDPSTPPDPAIKTGSHFLMLSACQSYQTAKEAHDENNMPHGAFTISLLTAMKQLSVNASATDIFNDARAILKCNGKDQEPSITGASDRRSGTLFGIGKGVLSDKVLVPVMGKDDVAKTVTLQGGVISGLNVDNELKNNDGTVTLKVTQVDGADKCIAKVTSGDYSKINGGDLFEVTNWVSSQKTFLKIYIPASDLSYEKVAAMGDVCSKLKTNSAVKWVYDLDKQDPTVSLFYKDGKWFANTAKGQVSVNSFTPEKIAAQFAGSKLFINIPPTKELLDSFNRNLKGQANVQIISNPGEANYTLLGRFNTDNKPEYTLFNFGASLKDSLESMPVRTDYEPLTKTSVNDVVSKLTDFAYKLGKIRVWFTLSNPAGNKGFPYALEIRDEATDKKIEKEAVVDEKISFHIVKDKSNKNNAWDNTFRYVYIFVIDHNGAMQLIYPKNEDGNDMNHFPDQTNPKSDDYAVPGIFTISAPTGTDNYYMFTSTDPIITYNNTFNQEGVSKGDSRGAAGGLDDLLNLGNISTRGVKVSTPNNWAIQKKSLKTVYKMTP